MGLEVFALAGQHLAQLVVGLGTLGLGLQDLAQHGFGVAQVLQGVDLQHHVKRGVVKHGQAFVQVELDHVDAALHAGQNIGVVNLDAIAGASARALQMVQHGAVAAAQVQHPAAPGHQIGQGLHHLGVAHAGTSCKDICAK